VCVCVCVCVCGPNDGVRNNRCMRRFVCTDLKNQWGFHDKQITTICCDSMFAAGIDQMKPLLEMLTNEFGFNTKQITTICCNSMFAAGIDKTKSLLELLRNEEGFNTKQIICSPSFCILLHVLNQFFASINTSTIGPFFHTAVLTIELLAGPGSPHQRCVRASPARGPQGQKSWMPAR